MRHIREEFKHTCERIDIIRKNMNKMQRKYGIDARWNVADYPKDYRQLDDLLDNLYERLEFFPRGYVY